MSDIARAKEPFTFYTRLHLTELTGLRASTPGQLLELIRQVPDSCIYHHTHRFLLQHQYLSPEPPNDFAYWVTEVLGEDELGERLASIDTIQFRSIESLRQEIITTIDTYLRDNPWAKTRFAKEEEAFHFVKSVSFVIPTNYSVYDLKEFTEALRKVTVESIYFHVFEARLRLQETTHDFSNWIETSLGDKELAKKISGFDPYTHTLEDLRNMLIGIIETRIGG